MSKTLYTIGHSNLAIEEFIALLKKFNVQILVDIRSKPYSSYVKHFNKENLKVVLHKAGIDYFYGGNELGGMPDNEQYYVDGKVDFELIRKGSEYKKGLQVVKKLVSLKTVVLLCAEENPLHCHRNGLITRDLIKIGYEVKHIRSDGSCEIASLESTETPLDTKIQNKHDVQNNPS